MTRAVLLALAFACPAVATNAAPTGDATVALNFQDVDIPVLAKFVSEVTGRNFIVDERVKGLERKWTPARSTPFCAIRSSACPDVYSTRSSGRRARRRRATLGPLCPCMTTSVSSRSHGPRSSRASLADAAIATS